MQITRERILENIGDAIEYVGEHLTENDKKVLTKVIDSHLNELTNWRVSDYLDFADVFTGEGLVSALNEYGFISSEDIGLPSNVEIPLSELDTDLEDSISEWLSEHFDYCVSGCTFEIVEARQVVVVTDIDWDIS